jgi:predicted negative regulator of RcsB-dependent stress response
VLRENGMVSAVLAKEEIDKWDQVKDWAYHNSTLIIIIGLCALAYVAWTFRR